jgi:hypothetical protein
MQNAADLPRDLYYQIVHELRGALPPPVGDAPEDRVHRDNAIISQVAALAPATADEVLLAVQYVAASAQALDCLRLARLYPADVPAVLKCTAQSASMMRQSRGARSQLLRLQAARETREADPAAHDRTAAMEQAAMELTAEALATAPPQVATPSRSEQQPARLCLPDRCRDLCACQSQPGGADPLARASAEKIHRRPAAGCAGPRHRQRVQPNPAGAGQAAQAPPRRRSLSRAVSRCLTGCEARRCRDAATLPQPTGPRPCDRRR